MRRTVAYIPKLDLDAEAMVSWVENDTYGVDYCTLKQLHEHSKVDDMLEVVIPGEGVLRLRVQLPTRSKKAQRAIPWAIEDHLTTPVEDQQLAWRPVPGKASAAFDVLVCDQHWHEAQMELLREAGLAGVRLIPLHALLELPDTEAAARQTHEIAPFRFFAEPLGSGSLPEPFWTAPVDNCVASEELPRWLLERVPDSVGFIKKAPFTALNHRPWLAAAALALWLGLLAGLQYYNHQLDGQIASIREANAARVREVAPELDTRRNLELQINKALAQHRREARGSAEGQLKLLPYLNRLAEVASKSSQEFKILSLSYRDKQLLVTLEAPSMDNVPKLRSFLIAEGLPVEIRSLRATDALAHAELVIAVEV